MHIGHKNSVLFFALAQSGGSGAFATALLLFCAGDAECWAEREAKIEQITA